MNQPEQLNQQTRRSFLRTTLESAGTVGAASLVLQPKCLQAAEGKRKPLSFIIVTDTHLGYRDNEGAAKQWEKTAAELATAKGDLVLHLGDVVDGGRAAQYPSYLKAREVIGKPVHEIPGNHDPEELFTKYLRKEIDTVVDHEWLRFLLLNNSRTTSHDGFLSEKQISWIDEQCADAAAQQKFVILCLHVPVHQNRHPDRGWYVKPDEGQTKFYEVMKQHEQRVIGLFHGHFHNGLRGWNDHGSLQEICFPSALYNLDRKLEAQKAPGYNPIEFRPGYTLAQIENGTMTLTCKPTGAEPKVKKPYALSQLKNA